jgi:hypothetical protein
MQDAVESRGWMLQFALELVVGVAIFAGAWWVYHRQERLGPDLSARARFVEIVAFVAIGLAISNFVVRPLLWRFAPEIVATGTTYGKSVETPLDYVLFAYAMVIWVGYMYVRPSLLGAIGVGNRDDSADEDATVQTTLGSDEE